ncbi:tetratricopeptide repeat protein [Parvicella tangerina]|uniref:Tetratricopeptide repeat protein n=1 Tax=Parvicella tangerina TaxID=2829795 RepID=A0A916NCY5_9FLAO|nr:hypothetical protein [Parvicella tangerina]CAG5084035.1 hypothetical protein CRYO30217_02358 [Parvicella tangerina]
MKSVFRFILFLFVLSSCGNPSEQQKTNKDISVFSRENLLDEISDLHSKKDYEQLIPLLHEMKDSMYFNVQYYSYLTEIYFDLGETDSAKKYTNQAIDRYPDIWEFEYYSLKLLYCESQLEKNDSIMKIYMDHRLNQEDYGNFSFLYLLKGGSKDSLKTYLEEKGVFNDPKWGVGLRNYIDTGDVYYLFGECLSGGK